MAEHVVPGGFAESIARLEQAFGELCSSKPSEGLLKEARVVWLGKTGHIKELFKNLREVDADSRPVVAAAVNSLRDRAEAFFAAAEQHLADEQLNSSLAKESFDLSLPSKGLGVGAIHPIALVERSIARILRECGFAVVEGPEIETDYFCFDSLNIPPHHPARDMQDTFYTETGHVLRTHTTSVQARVLKAGGLPVKVASFGRAYRNETEDASHQAMFHQFELMWVEKGLTLANLMGLITHIMHELYGARRKLKFVPKFYPYTEPSIGVLLANTTKKGESAAPEEDIGDGEWATVAGAGMIHHNVLREFGYDPSQVSGLAFGLGTSRLAAQLYGFADLRTLYDNDLRLLAGIRG